jgi:predicted ATPase
MCGENGTGKTSFLDALEYSIAGTSSLFGNNRLGVSWELAAPHIVTVGGISTLIGGIKCPLFL